MASSPPTLSTPPAHIAVVGGSGSGKTWLAGKIVAAHEGQAAPISLDDFYHDLSHLPPAERDAVNFDDPAAIDWEKCGEVMGAMRTGETIQLPVYDFATHARRPETRSFVPPALVVWDGLWLLHHAWMRERFAVTVFVECGVEERFRRRAERDVAERGRSPESIERQFFEQVEPMHGQFVEPQRQHAGHILVSPPSAGELEKLLGKTGPSRNLESRQQK